MSQTRTHWKKLRNPDYLGAYDFEEGEKRQLEIKSVVQEKIKSTDGKEEDCLIIRFTTGKPIICNATNAKMISKLTNSNYIEDWIGKSIIIAVRNVKAFGSTMEALRVLADTPQSTKPKLTFPSETFNEAKKALADGIVTIDKIKKKYELSTQIEQMLCAQ